MPYFRRWYVPGGTYFFTVVAYRRRRLFRNLFRQQQLGDILRDVRTETPFETVAMVLLWDHLHAIWTLPKDDDDYSGRWQKIKGDFTAEFLRTGGVELPVTAAQREAGRRGVWQPRFWEHVVRDEEELSALCDYIHYNPVKHGYVSRPCDWESSTFHRFVKKGHYSMDWGRKQPLHLRQMDFE
jgi:putative transposase